MNPQVNAFFDTSSNTISYVAAGSATRRCTIIDPVLRYDPHPFWV